MPRRPRPLAEAAEEAAILGTFRFSSTETTHIVLTGGRTLCHMRTGYLDEKGNAEWELVDQDSPVTCRRCSDMAIKGTGLPGG